MSGKVQTGGSGSCFGRLRVAWTMCPLLPVRDETTGDLASNSKGTAGQRVLVELIYRTGRTKHAASRKSCNGSRCEAMRADQREKKEERF
jgi:hypothetical protein